MKFYLWYGEHAEDMASPPKEFDQEEEMLTYINQIVLKFPKMCFEAFYGRKLELEPNQVIASYKIKK